MIETTFTRFLVVLPLLFGSLKGSVPAGQTDPQADAILLASLEAHGGRGAVEALRDAVLSGESRVYLAERTVDSQVRIEIRSWDQIRTVADAAGSRQEFVSDGRFASNLSGEGRQAFTERRTANRIVPYNPVAGILRAYLQDKVSLEFLGRERRSDGEFDLVAIRLLDSDARRIEEGRPLDRTYHVLIDAGTALIREMLEVSDDWDSDRPDLWERWVYSDYRKFDDMLVPYKVEMYRYGHRNLEIQLDSFASEVLEGEFKP